ncbi:Protein SPT2 [Nymphon striatum]|nr:Protein SPT2 [Nymphon striatum]
MDYRSLLNLASEIHKKPIETKTERVVEERPMSKKEKEEIIELNNLKKRRLMQEKHKRHPETKQTVSNSSSIHKKMSNKSQNGEKVVEYVPTKINNPCKKSSRFEEYVPTKIGKFSKRTEQEYVPTKINNSSKRTFVNCDEEYVPKKINNSKDKCSQPMQYIPTKVTKTSNDNLRGYVPSKINRKPDDSSSKSSNREEKYRSELGTIPKNRKLSSDRPEISSKQAKNVNSLVPSNSTSKTINKVSSFETNGNMKKPLPPRPPSPGSRFRQTQRRPMAIKRRRIESEDEDDSDMSDFIDNEPMDEEIDYTSHIKEIFKYDKTKYADIDKEDIREASFAEQMKEECRSSDLKAGCIVESSEDLV